MIAGTLEIQLMAQMARLATDMKQAQSIVGTSMQSIESSVGSAKALLKDFAAAFSVEKLIEYARHVLDTADQLGKMSQKVGVSVEDLSKLRYAAELNDVSMESFAKGVKKMSQEMVDARDPTSKQGQLMSVLGVNIRGGLIPALDQVADMFAALPDGPTKAALAVELFGRAGLDMIPLLNKGSEGLKAMRDEAERLGLVMTKEMAEAAEKFNDNLKTLKFQTEAAAATLLEQMLPSLIRITGAMSIAATEGNILWKILIGIGGVMAETAGLNDDGARRMQAYIQGLYEERDALEAMKKAGAELLPGEQARLDLLNRQIESERILREGREKAKAAEVDPGVKMLQDVGIQIADAVMEGIKKKNEERVASVLALANASKQAQSELASAHAAIAVAQAQLGATTIDLTVSQKKLLELQTKPEWKIWGEVVRGQITAALEEASVIERQAAAHQTALRAMQEFDKMQAEALAGTASLLPAEKKLLDLQTSEAWKFMTEEDKKATEAKAALTAQTELAAIGMKNYADVLRTSQADEEKMTAEFVQQNKTLEEQINTYGMAEDAVTRYRAAQLLSLAAVLEQIPGMEGFADSLRKQAAAMEDVARNQGVLKGLQDQTAAWGQLGDMAGTFLTDVVNRTKTAAQSLRDIWHSFFNELLRLFAKKLVLQLGASLTGSEALQTAATNAGAGTLAGSLLGSGAGGFLGYGTGAGLIGGASTFFGAATGAIPAAAIGADAVAAGVGVNTVAANAGAWMSGLGATGWGLIIVAAVAVLSRFFGSHGGPKLEGQFTAAYDDMGKPTGANVAPGFNIIGTAANPAMEQFTNGVAQAITSAIQSYGGRSAGFEVGAGIVKDPSGTAQTMVDILLRSASGQELLRVHNANVGRSNEEAQAEMAIDAQRAVLAALQSTELPSRIAEIFKGMDAGTATAEEITAAFNKANAVQANYAAATAHFAQLFGTEAESVAAAQKTLDKTFSDLGLAVPKTVEELKAMLAAAQASGDNKTEDALLGVADAFKVVTDAAAAAADKLKSDWEDVQSSIDRITGRDRSGENLNSIIAQFVSLNSGVWSGRGNDEIIAALTTITEQDFANYSEASRELIKTILKLATGVDNLGGSVDTLAQANWNAYQQTIGSAQDYAKTWFSNLQSALSGEDFSTRTSAFIASLTTQVANTSAQLEAAIQEALQQQGYSLTTINAWKQQFGSLANYWMSSYNYGTGGFANIDAMFKQLDIYKQYLATQSADLIKYWELENQYAGHGEQLLELEKWYDQQKALVGNNADALAALAATFQEKWDAIINGASGAGGSLDQLAKSIENAKENIRKFHDSLLLSAESPLTATQRWMAALDSYNKNYDLAKLNDLTSLQNYSQIAQQLLQEAISYYGRASPEYVALFNQILADSQLLGTPVGTDPVVSSVDAVRFTIEEQNRLLREQIAALTQQVVTLTAAVTTSGDATVSAIESSLTASSPAPALT